MEYLIAFGVVAVGVCVVICYACAVISGISDRRIERMHIRDRVWNWEDM